MAEKQTITLTCDGCGREEKLVFENGNIVEGPGPNHGIVWRPLKVRLQDPASMMRSRIDLHEAPSQDETEIDLNVCSRGCARSALVKLASRWPAQPSPQGEHTPEHVKDHLNAEKQSEEARERGLPAITYTLDDAAKLNAQGRPADSACRCREWPCACACHGPRLV